MNVGKAIYYLLSNAESVTNIAGTRIYPELAEQEAVAPYAVYQIVSVNPDDTNDGPAVIDEVVVDILCVAESYNEAADLATAVRASLDRVRGTYNGVNVESIQYDSTDSDVQDSPRRYEQTVTLTVRVFRDAAQIATGQNIDQLTLGRLYDVTDNATTGQVIIKQADGTWAAGDQGTGTGGVDSVNGETGIVTLTTDDISDSGQTNKYTTAAEITKLAGIEAGAQVNDVTSVNGQTGAITGLATTAYVDAEVNAEESARITADSSLQTQITANDGDITALQGRMTTAESDIDALEAADYVNTVNSVDGAVTIAAGSNVTVSTAGQTITISSSGGGGGGNKFTNIDGVTADSGSSAVDLVASTGMTITPNNTTKTITFAVSGLDTDDITEAANLYYTDARADARIAAASVTDLSDVTSAGSGAIITTAERSKLAGIEAGAQVNVATDLTHTTSTLTVRVESSTGSDTTILAASASAAGVMTAADRTKLDGIAAGAEVNVQSDWNAVSGDALILNKPTLAAVATSGSYNDLSNTPTIPPQFFYTTTDGATSITLDTGDEGRYIRCTASSAVTVTIPADKFQADDEIIIEQSGTGQVTIAAGSGVTLNNSASNTNKTAERYSVVALKCTATNVFTLTGERELA